jgi:diguanylate cyclase (GGDEF)-like protein
MKPAQTILVVDDDPIILDLIDIMFKDDVKVLRAENGNYGVEIARTELPDLILLDVRMPNLDGYEVCRQLKEQTETMDIPVVFLTARTETQDEFKGLELGAIDYIAKPIVPQIVEVRIRNHLMQKKMRDQLAIMSSVDGLTGLSNRRRFDEYMDQEWRRGGRNEYPISLLMIDVDHFKLYNDTYGHQQGDNCLRAVADEIATHLRRPSDLTARYGGEEFAVVLPDTPLEPAMDLAERIRAGIDGLNMEHTASETADHVTISIGLSSVVPSDEITIESFIEAADKNLYQSKHNGRNRVTGSEA